MRVFSSSRFGRFLHRSSHVSALIAMQSKRDPELSAMLASQASVLFVVTEFKWLIKVVGFRKLNSRLQVGQVR